jgi:glycosyltransferase involved in cell wall biosynthesis
LRYEEGTAGMLVSIVIPTWNEQDNVKPLSEAVIKLFQEELPAYDYEIIFIDNHSTDQTQQRITELCSANKKIKAIFNVRNFGQFNSPYYALCQTYSDCTILLYADFQEPVDMIPQFIHEWEKGYRIVCGIKTSSRENRFMYLLRSIYYKVIKKMSDVDQIEHFTGFGLYDQSFINTLRELHDSVPFLRGIVAELGPDRKELPYEQAKRRAGKTSNNLYRLYDAAMLGLTSYTKVGMRLATFIGFISAIISIIIALVYLVLKLLMWDQFPAGMAPVLIGVFIFGSVQLFFIGILGEYIMNVNTRVMRRPLVIEEKRINFD